jgi:hypothetical protein
MTTLESYLTERLNKQLLRYAVGLAMACPVRGCDVIMDCTKAVLIDNTAICGACFDGLPLSTRRSAEVIDGRILFTAPPKYWKPTRSGGKRAAESIANALACIGKLAAEEADFQERQQRFSWGTR